MFNKDFYPTPDKLINKMLSDADFYSIRTVLEPSAGQGHIVKKVNEKMKYVRNNYNYNNNKNTMYDIDCIEIDENLTHILKGNNMRVIHDDFLTFTTHKKYDLIIANFPFSEGCKHLLKAIELQRQFGGNIVCLINAETLKNPYSNARKDLAQQLDELDAQIEYIQDTFADSDALRNTNVEVALIKISIPRPDGQTSTILNKLKQDEKQTHHTSQQSDIVDADFIIGAIQRYNHEIKAGVSLIHEYEKLKPLLSSEFDKEDVALKLVVSGYDNEKETYIDNVVNGYVKKIRYKYWKTLLNSKDFSKLLTEAMRDEYNSKLDDLQNYDFSIYNINQVRADISKHLIRSLEDAILKLFEDFTHKYNYSEYSKNIHLYNGWKTNKAYKINKKVIIPLNGWDSWNASKLDFNWALKNRLSDIEKVFDYLAGGSSDHSNLYEILKHAQENNISKKIETKYCTLTFFKKGTCHIIFKDEDLLQKFNLFGGKSKGWLPPNYGKASYSNMTQDEQKVVDEFEGKESYNNTVANADYFLFNASDILQIENTVA